MIRAYLFALDPTDAQAEAMRSHCGAVRVAYNWCLARVWANWAQRAAEQTYGLTGDQLTPWINTSAYSLRKGVERRQEHRGAVVGGELEGGIRLRVCEPVDRAGQPA